MNLFQLLFEEVEIEEAAKTANDAAALDYAIIHCRPDGQYLYVLIDTKDARASLAKTNSVDISLFEWFTDISDSIKGVMYLNANDDGKTFSVSNSAAISGFGPLLYELAMSEISPKYLISDNRVSPAAMAVWTKFYERQEVNKVPIESLYQWPCEEEATSKLHFAANYITKNIPDKLDALAIIESRLANCRNGNTKSMPSTEEFFTELASKIDLKLLPMLFGYSMQHSSPMTIKVLKNEGNLIANELMKRFELKRGDFYLGVKLRGDRLLQSNVPFIVTNTMFARNSPSILSAILFSEQSTEAQLTTPIQSMQGGLVLDPESVMKVNAALSKLGIGPIGDEEGFAAKSSAIGNKPLSDDSTSLLEIVIDDDDTHPIDRINTSGGGGKTTKDVSISPEALELARKFYIAGKRGENWYYDAAKTLHEGFEDEQELTLFTLLLAATSVQNEIYGNLIEAGAMFNAIMQDMRENVDLLERFVTDPKAISMDLKGIKQTEYASLHIYQTVIKSKIINIAAKMGNIAKAVSLMFANKLDRNTVISLIANSIDLSVPNTNFDARTPFFRKLKIANYALTLLDPEYASTDQNPFNVVVDTWMIRTFYPGKTKKDEISLLSNERAYAEVAKAVAQLADEAGVSPHAMQAAIWLGVREQTASELGGEPDYISAIKKLVDGYSELWAGIDKETMTLRDVIKNLNSNVAATALQDKRADWMRNLVKQTQDKRRKAKLLAASSSSGQGNLPF